MFIGAIFLKVFLVYAFWCHYGIIGGPSPLQSMPNDMVVNAESVAHVGDATSESARRNNVIAPAVSCLFFLCGPPAIFRTVIRVIVDPVQCFPLRALAHICEEIAVGFPPVADVDSSPAVSGISRCSRVSASLNHRGPSCVRCAVAWEKFWWARPACFIVAVSQGIQPHDSGRATVTFNHKLPICRTTRRNVFFGFGNNSKTCEAGSRRDNYSFRHKHFTQCLCLAAGLWLQPLLAAPSFRQEDYA